MWFVVWFIVWFIVWFRTSEFITDIELQKSTSDFLPLPHDITLFFPHLSLSISGSVSLSVCLSLSPPIHETSK